MSPTIQIVSIEGNIGSGKSTLLANLKKHFKDNSQVIFLKEPVDEWSNIKDENGTTILEKFYADQEKYSFPFQMMAYISRLKLLKDTIDKIKAAQKDYAINTLHDMMSNYDMTKNYLDEKPTHYTIITERSLYTDQMVFAKMLYDTKKIEHINYQIYLNWFDTFAKEFPVNKIIYVKANPEICHERIGIRHREGESNIPIEYLADCDKYHDAMLDLSSNECVCDDQLVLNGNNNIYENVATLNDWISSIEIFMSGIKLSKSQNNLNIRDAN